MGTEPGWIYSFSLGRCLCCLNTDNVLALYQYCSSDCTATTHKAQTHHHNSNSSLCLLGQHCALSTGNGDGEQVEAGHESSPTSWESSFTFTASVRPNQACHISKIRGGL